MKNLLMKEFFFQKKKKSLKSYFEDDFIKKIGDKYLKNKLQAAFTLSNRVVYKDQNLGSEVAGIKMLISINLNQFYI